VAEKSRGRTWLTFCGLARKDTQPLSTPVDWSAEAVNFVEATSFAIPDEFSDVSIPNSNSNHY
jgi:hypothetical protein